MSELDATYGGRTADAYLSLEDASAWIRENILRPAPWVNAGDPDRTIALREAARLIDSASRWKGEPYFYFQLRAFPRVEGAPATGSRAEPDATFLNLLETNEFLRQQKINVRAAACEQAVYVLGQGGEDASRDEQFQGIRSVSRGHRMSESFGYDGTHLVICPRAWNYLAPYAGGARLLRGDSGHSIRGGG